MAKHGLRADRFGKTVGGLRVLEGWREQAVTKQEAGHFLFRIVRGYRCLQVLVMVVKECCLPSTVL